MLRLFILVPVRPPTEDGRRRGVFFVVGALCLVMCLSFVAYGVDIGYMVLVQTEMQNAVDAAALAAAQEITAAVENAPADLGGADITAYARQQAVAKAVEVAQLNKVFVDGSVDVSFGRRSYNATTAKFEITWGVMPANCVKVIARRDDPDTTQPDGRLPLIFARAMGHASVPLQASAVAYVEARDLVVVHDFSRSMNFDSYYSNEANTRLTRNQISSYALTVWDDLGLQIDDFPRIPEYLKYTQTDSTVTTTAEFRYNKCVVTSNNPIVSVEGKYTSGSTKTWLAPTSGSVLTGTSNLAQLTVTVALPNPQPYSQSSDGITVNFSQDRKQYSISSSPRRLVYVDVYYEDGSYLRRTMSSNTYSYSKTESKAVDYLRINSKQGSNSTWTIFNPPPTQVVQDFYDNDTMVKTVFGMNYYPWPYPSGSWNGYINFCRTYSELADNDADPSDTDFRERFGGVTLACYLLRYCSGNWECPDLWKTRHYPFHAIKEGHMLLCDFLEGLGFDDQLGMVSYDSSHRQEKTLNVWDSTLGSQVTVNITDDPVTNDYSALRNIMKYKQAAHYSYATNMGGGLKDGVALLDVHAREGARPTIILMTDGNSNTIDSGTDTSLPSGWNWDQLFDYDGDGSADYYTSDTQKRYCLKLAKEAVDKDYTIHTMSVGADADRDLLEAIAFLGKGHYIDVPGGYSVSDMQEQVEAAFHRIATLVPPARLLPSDSQ